MKLSPGQVDDDYQFGSASGDPQADIDDFRLWLAEQGYRGILKSDCKSGEIGRQQQPQIRANRFDDVHDAQEFASAGQVDMSDFLKKLSALYVRLACDHMGTPLLSLPPTVTLGSLCAGSGTGELTFEAAVACISDHFLTPLESRVEFCCEKVPWKQDHLKTMVPRTTCIFDDVTTLGAHVDDQMMCHRLIPKPRGEQGQCGI